ASANWARSAAEVESILKLLTTFLEREGAALAAANLQCRVIGRRDRLPPRLHAAIQAVEAATRDGRGLQLRLAVDYSARHEIAVAAANAIGRWAPGVPPNAALIAGLIEQHLDAEAGPVDLLIRTGGERRLSDFLLWESACAELYFTRTPWPEFGARGLRRALAAYARRRRTFGRSAPVEHQLSARVSA
ncbi:MAG: polyprenyl diphosphate synthase, partial [Terriglobales bacterium]